jgi:hypothetical protein
MSHQWFRVPLEGWRKIVEESGPREKAAQILYVTLHVNLFLAKWNGTLKTDEKGLEWMVVEDRKLARESNLAKKTIGSAIQKLVDADLILAKRIPKNKSEYHLKLGTPGDQTTKNLGTWGTTPGDHSIKNRSNRSKKVFQPRIY